MAINDVNGRLAVVTGGGTGMGRELVRKLAAAGAHVAMCDINADNMAETANLVETDGSGAVTVSSHVCDVADEASLIRFAEAVRSQHDTEQLNLLFNNAGIGGGGSFVADPRETWERTFDICWGGVYRTTRVFLDMLLAAEAGAVVNTSSVNGFWASIGPQTPHTSYSAAKFAVKGFTEALIADFRVNAPHLSAHVVMPGHIGTSIALNSTEILGLDVVELRKRLALQGLPVDGLSDEQLEAMVIERGQAFRDNAPTSAAQAADVILDGVLSGQWRILIGDDAHALDELVREDPWAAYETDFVDRITGRGHLRGLMRDDS